MNRKTKAKLLLVSLAASSAFHSAATLNIYAGGGDEDQAMGDCAQASAVTTAPALRTLFDIARSDRVSIDEFRNTLRGFGTYANRLSELNKQDNNGDTVLHIAASLGHLELVRFILRNYDVDLSLRNSDGQTAFDVAHEAVTAAITMGAVAGENNGIIDPLQKKGEPTFQKCVGLMTAEPVEPSQKEGEATSQKCDPLTAAESVAPLQKEDEPRIPPRTESVLRAIRIKEMIINFTKIRELVRDGNYQYMDIADLVPYITPDTVNIMIDGHRLLELAIDRNDEEMIELLLSKHASANAPIMHEGEALTPFKLAIKKGDVKLVRRLIEHGADVNLDNPLSYAISSLRDPQEIVGLLIENGAGVNISVVYERETLTLLKSAIKKGDAKFVECLIKHGADVNLDNPLFYALGSQSVSQDIVRLLVENGANADVSVMHEGEILTPLKLAIKNGDANLVKCLIEHGADVNLGNPLSYALRLCHDGSRKDLNIIRLLLDRGADLNSVKDDEFKKAIKKIGSRGATAELNRSSDESGNTIFHFVVKYGRLELTKFLLENYDFNPDLENKEGLTVFGVANAAVGNAVEPIQNIKASRIARMVSDFANIRDLLRGQRRFEDMDISEVLKCITKNTANIVISDSDTSLLEVSVKSGNFEAVKTLIDRGVDVNRFNRSSDWYYSRGIVSLAIYNCRNTDIAKYLVEHGADVNAPAHIWFDMYYGETLTPLGWAIRRHDFGLVKYLIDHGADVNLNKPLYYAISSIHQDLKGRPHPNLEIVKLLLDRGAKFDGEIEHTSLLQYAFRCGYFDIVALLVEHGADPNFVRYDDPMVNQIVEKRLDPRLLELFLAHGAKPNEMHYNRTPLDVAARNDDLNAISLLLRYNADPNTRDKDGDTPLTIAARNGNVEAVRLLLQNKADPDMQGYNGLTPLNMAVLSIKNMEKFDQLKYENYMNIVRMLLEANAKTDIGNEDGITPLEFAISSHNHDLVELLFKRHGAAAVFESETGKSLLCLAIDGKCEFPIIKTLVLSGANHEMREKQRFGRTALHKAVASGNYEVVSYLIENCGAKINQPDTWSRETPLHVAVDSSYDIIVESVKKTHKIRSIDDSYKFVNSLRYTKDKGLAVIEESLKQTGDMEAYEGYLKIAQLLLEKGADVNLQDKYHRTPLAFAADKNNPRFFIELLKSNPGVVDNSALIQAIGSGNYEEVKRLILGGADARSPGIDNQTPLYLVLRITNDMIWDLLMKTFPAIHLHYLNTPGNVSIPPMNNIRAYDFVSKALNDTGNMPKYRNYMRIAELLIEHGADVNEINGRNSLLRIAESGHNPKFAELLSKHGAR